MRKIMIAPSILSADFSRLGEGVNNCQKWGADLVHFDVMDGVFVPNITFGMGMLKAVKHCADIPFDVHLMITKPEKYVEQFIAAGADIVTFHAEASEKVGETLDLIHSLNKRGGLVLNPDRPISDVLPYLDKIDQIIIMGVFAGFGGQKFIPSVLEKVKELKAIIDQKGLDIDLELDGGVTVDNVAEIKASGINMIVAGSAVFRSTDPEQTIKLLRENA